tara:strand:- start:1806 stop:2252 length:447 start_codon:yes stop_codon:yes gene_type:complete
MMKSLAAQKPTWQTKFDTIEVFNDHIYAEYETFKDSNLLEKTNAFLYPTIQQIPRFRKLPNLFLIEYDADSIVFHGEKTTYLEDRSYKVENYYRGTIISTYYFSSDGNKITERAYMKDRFIIGPCGEIRGHYFYHGRRKNQNRTSKTN